MSYQDSNASAKTYNLADHTSFVDVRGEVGVTLTVGTPSVKVLQVDDSGNVRYCTGATVPSNADAGYAQGCIFVNTAGGAGTTLYVNEGSAMSATFRALDTAGGFSLPTTAADTTTTTGTSFGITANSVTTGKILSITGTGLTTGNGLLVTGPSSALVSFGQGATNPAFVVDASTATSATGLKIKSAAAAAGVALSVISSGTNENLIVDAKGSGNIVIGGTSTGQVSIGRGFVGTTLFSGTITSLGTVQNSTPTAAQLLTGFVTQTSATGAGTVTLPTGTLMSGAVSGLAVGDNFDVVFANLGGGFNLTITGATGMTVVGNGVIPSGKNGYLNLINTGANTWNCYVIVSA